MNIMVPLAGMEMLDGYCRAGADELYFGFYDDVWTGRFGIFEEINRMSLFGSAANFSLEEIPDVIEAVKSRGKKAYVTLNSAAYSRSQLIYLDRLLSERFFQRADGIIAGDPCCVRLVQKHGMPVVLSTMAGAYNRLIVSFYKELGVTRMILPRDMQLSDLEAVVKEFPEISFEVFFMRNGCRYSDSHCMSFHGRKYDSMCACMDSAQTELELPCGWHTEEKREAYQSHMLFARAFHKEACGMCALLRLYQAGVESLKIVGRADRPEDVEHDIQRVKKEIAQIQDGVQPGGEEFAHCLYGLNCYYHL